MHMKISPSTVAKLQGEHSRAYLIWQAVMRKELTSAEGEKHMALYTAESVEAHKPNPYPLPSLRLLDYLKARLSGMASRDATMAVKNGEWIELMVRVRSRNLSDYELLMWAGRKCKEIGATNACDKLREMVMRHVASYDNFPFDEFDQATRVQQMDSDEKRDGKTK